MNLIEKLKLPANECLLRERDEAPTFIGCKRRTLAQLRYSGKGPAFKKIGREVYYTRADLLRWATNLEQAA